MKRAPIVLTGTACGLLAVVGYHAATPGAMAALNSGSSASAGSLNIGGGSSTSKGTGSSSASSSSSSAHSSVTTAARAATTRSAVGSDVQYGYGDVEVKVTMTGSKITDVSLVRHSAYDQRSAMIDQVALPQLHSQALSLQNGKVDGVSGATYTSEGYAQSLQSAIDKLKV